jgi:hypothetical protein
MPEEYLAKVKRELMASEIAVGYKLTHGSKCQTEWS